jgi:hypothetical protein
VAGAQIVAEPGDDQRDRLDMRRHRLQPVERDHEVRRVGERVDVLGEGAPFSSRRTTSVA